MADLWCVVIQGNDDTIPCASRAAAVRGATWTNLCLHKVNMRHAYEATSPVLWASPAPWTGTPEAHAEGLAAENARDPRWSTIDDRFLRECASQFLRSPRERHLLDVDHTSGQATVVDAAGREVTQVDDEPLVSLRLVPVIVFGAEDGYGLGDAVSAWSDCNRAIGRIYRVDEPGNAKYRNPGDTVEVFVRTTDARWFARHWGNDRIQFVEAKEDGQ